MTLRTKEAMEFLSLVVGAVRSRSVSGRAFKRGAELLVQSALPGPEEPQEAPPAPVVVQSVARAAPAPPRRPGEPAEVPLVEVNGVWQRRR